MRVMIQLKPEDADGRGGEILSKMGMTRSPHTPTNFRALVLSEPDDPHWDDRDLAMPYIEALRDEDITPIKVRVKTRSIPYNMMTANAQKPPAAKSGVARAMAKVTEVLSASVWPGNERTVQRQMEKRIKNARAKLKSAKKNNNKAGIAKWTKTIKNAQAAMKKSKRRDAANKRALEH